MYLQRNFLMFRLGSHLIFKCYSTKIFKSEEWNKMEKKVLLILRKCAFMCKRDLEIVYYLSSWKTHWSYFFLPWMKKNLLYLKICFFLFFVFFFVFIVTFYIFNTKKKLKWNDVFEEHSRGYTNTAYIYWKG